MVHIIRTLKKILSSDNFYFCLCKKPTTAQSVGDIFIFISHPIPNDPKHFTNYWWCLLYHWTVKWLWCWRKRFWSKSTGQAQLLWKCHKSFALKNVFTLDLSLQRKHSPKCCILHQSYTAVRECIIITIDFWWSHSLKYFLPLPKGGRSHKISWPCQSSQGQPNANELARQILTPWEHVSPKTTPSDSL